MPGARFHADSKPRSTILRWIHDPELDSMLIPRPEFDSTLILWPELDSALISCPEARFYVHFMLEDRLYVDFKPRSSIIHWFQAPELDYTMISWSGVRFYIDFTPSVRFYTALMPRAQFYADSMTRSLILRPFHTHSSIIHWKPRSLILRWFQALELDSTLISTLGYRLFADFIHSSILCWFYARSSILHRFHVQMSILRWFHVPEFDSPHPFILVFAPLLWFRSLSLGKRANLRRMYPPRDGKPSFTCVMGKPSWWRSVVISSANSFWYSRYWDAAECVF